MIFDFLKRFKTGGRCKPTSIPPPPPSEYFWTNTPDGKPPHYADSLPSNLDGNWPGGNCSCICATCRLAFVGNARETRCRKCTRNHTTKEPSRFDSHPFTSYVGPIGAFDGDDQPEPTPPPMFPHDQHDDDRLTPGPGYQPITSAPPREPEDNDHPHWRRRVDDNMAKIQELSCATDAQTRAEHLADEPLVCSRCGHHPFYMVMGCAHDEHTSIAELANQPATLPNPEAAVQPPPEAQPKSGASLSIELAKGKLEIKSAALSATFHF